MPYYVWQGVTLTGDMQTGILFARTPAELDEHLCRRDIAVVRSREKELSWWQRRNVPAKVKVQFFQQLSLLLSSGVFLAEALDLVRQQMSNNLQMQEVITHLADAVEQGIPLGKAMMAYPTVFDHLMVQMAYVGGETASLARACSALSEDLIIKQEMQARLRSALLVPAVTFSCFLAIAAILVVAVVPRFASIFALYGTELPLITKRLLGLSALVGSWQFCAAFGGLVVSGVMLGAYLQSAHGKLFFDRFVLRLPVIGTFVRLSVTGCAIRSLGMLVERGMPLVTALKTVRSTVANSVLQEQLGYIEHEVLAGGSVSQAMRNLKDSMFDLDCCAAVRIGQESGNIAPMLLNVAAMYHEKIKQDLTRITTLLQPCLMLLLGLMIAALIMAVYMPIFSMAQVIG